MLSVKILLAFAFAIICVVASSEDKISWQVNGTPAEIQARERARMSGGHGRQAPPANFDKPPVSVYQKNSEIAKVLAGRSSVVTYYNAMCPHSKKFAPQFINAAKEYVKEENPSLLSHMEIAHEEQQARIRKHAEEHVHDESTGERVGTRRNAKLSSKHGHRHHHGHDSKHAHKHHSKHSHKHDLDHDIKDLASKHAQEMQDTADQNRQKVDLAAIRDSLKELIAKKEHQMLVQATEAAKHDKKMDQDFDNESKSYEERLDAANKKLDEEQRESFVEIAKDSHFSKLSADNWASLRHKHVSSSGLGDVQWLALDARLHPNLGPDFKFKYFPGVFYVTSTGKHIMYKGSRDAWSVLQWAKKMNHAENSIAASYLEVSHHAESIINGTDEDEAEEQIGTPFIPPTQPSSLLEESDVKSSINVASDSISDRFLISMKKMLAKYEQDEQ